MNRTEAIYLALAVAFVVMAIVVIMLLFAESMKKEPTAPPEPKPLPIIDSPPEPINVVKIEEDDPKKKKDYSAGGKEPLKDYEANLVQSAMGISSDVMRVPNRPGVYVWQD